MVGATDHELADILRMQDIAVAIGDKDMWVTIYLWQPTQEVRVTVVFTDIHF